MGDATCRAASEGPSPSEPPKLVNSAHGPANQAATGVFRPKETDVLFAGATVASRVERRKEMLMSQTKGEPRLAANDHPAGGVAVPHVHLITIVDLLAEAFVAKLVAANDNSAPSEE